MVIIRKVLLFSELNPRNEFRVAIADLVAWWLLLYIVDVLGAILKLPNSAGIVSEHREVSSELALRLSEALSRCYLRRTSRSTFKTVHSEAGAAGRHN